jgi:hypothetical protein
MTGSYLPGTAAVLETKISSVREISEIRIV